MRRTKRLEAPVRSIVIAAAVLALGLAACGHNLEQRAATGAAAGLVVAGPLGAAVGAGVGAVVSKSTDHR